MIGEDFAVENLAHPEEGTYQKQSRTCSLPEPTKVDAALSTLRAVARQGARRHAGSRPSRSMWRGIGVRGCIPATCFEETRRVPASRPAG